MPSVTQSPINQFFLIQRQGIRGCPSVPFCRASLPVPHALSFMSLIHDYKSSNLNLYLCRLILGRLYTLRLVDYRLSLEHGKVNLLQFPLVRRTESNTRILFPVQTVYTRRHPFNPSQNNFLTKKSKLVHPIKSPFHLQPTVLPSSLDIVYISTNVITILSMR